MQSYLIPRRVITGWIYYFQRLRLFILITFPFLSYPVFAQTPSSLNISYFGLKSGLPNLKIFCIEQDHLGFIWIGTRNGLFRFDGTNYLPFYENCSPNEGLPSGTVMALMEDENNRLWVGTNGGLCWVNTENLELQWFNNPALSNTQVNSLELEGNKRMWAGRVDSIYAIDLASLTTIGFQARYANERWGLNLTEDLLLYKDSIMLACGAGAITQIDLKTLKVERIFSGKGALLCIYPYGSNQLIVSNYYKDAFIFNLSTRLPEPLINGHIEQRFDFPFDVFFSIIHKTLKDQRSFYLAAGQSGIVSLVDEPLHYGQSFDVFSGAPRIERPAAVYRFIESRDGNIWGASNAGLFKIDFEHQYFNAHSFGRMMQVCSDPIHKNMLWIVSYPTTITAFDCEKDTALITFTLPEKLKREKDEFIEVAFQDSAFRIWLGTNMGDVFRFDIQDRTWKIFPVHEFFPNQNIRITGISTLDQKEIWLATNLGLVRMNGIESKMQCHLYSNKLLSGLDEQISNATVRQDSKGRIWIFPSFVNPVIFNPRDTTFQEVPVTNCLGQQFNPPRTGNLCETADHEVWLVCNNTPCLLNEAKSVFESQDFRFKNVELENIIWLPDGNLVAAMADRLYIWHPRDSSIQEFSRHEGWPTSDVIWMQPLLGSNTFCLYDDDGEVVLFDPNDLKQLQCKSPILLTEFNILNKHKSINPLEINHTQLAYNENNIRFIFQALNYSDFMRMNYSFRLEGIEDAWNFGQESNSAIYTNLPDGDYTFWVKAKTGGEAWTEPVPLAAFSIATPFWRMIWFRFLIIAAIAGSVYALYQYRVRNLKRMLRVRTKISSDLHDDIGSTLTSIRVYSDLAKKQSGDQKLKGILDKIEENAGDMIQSMSDIVWTINPKYDDFTYVIQRMENFASNFLSIKEIQYAISKENKVEELKLDMEKRKNLFLIYKEALHNATKHSGCKRIVIRLVNAGKYLDMQIDDDGTGFNGSVTQNGNGLANMKERAEEVGGNFHFESQPGQGTSIKVSIPL